MTPDDLAERRNWDSAAWRHRDIVLLMDALEQAWALAESRREEANRWAAKFGEQQARAERAEADRGALERWQEEARQAYVDREYWRERAERAEAEAARNWDLADKLDRALARVRALCDQEAQPFGDIRVPVARIRAAIEGDNQ